MASTARRSPDRRSFVADPDVLSELGFQLSDLADPDTRAYVIRMEHPEIDEALREGRDEVEVGGEPVNARLHLTMHEIVANQLWDDDPPEVWETAQRLIRRGYDRHEILHMLAGAMSEQIWSVLVKKQQPDPAAHVAALRALPGSWEGERLHGRGKPRRGRRRRRR